MTTQLPTGFAAATWPVSAARVTTDAEGLDAGETEIFSGGFRMPAYRAKPRKGMSFPILLVVQEIFGVNAHIKAVTDRWAAEGYVALAPDIFWRVEPGVELAYTADGMARGRRRRVRWGGARRRGGERRWRGDGGSRPVLLGL